MPSETPLAFFSYARADSQFALQLARDLKVSGASVWLDQLDIHSGERWDKAVEDVLASCLLILSIPAVLSIIRQVLIRRLQRAAFHANEH